ncbi:MAG: DUF3347 domain-containing protein [Verrucomicrobiota bacterium]
MRIALFTFIFLFSSALGLHAESGNAEFAAALVQPYLQMQSGLAEDDLGKAQKGAKAFVQLANGAPVGSASIAQMKASATTIAESTDIKAARAAFLPLSEGMIAMVKSKALPDGESLYLVHCPMAFGGKGGSWIQADETVANPYYGSMMLRCGGVKEELTQ